MDESTGDDNLEELFGAKRLTSKSFGGTSEEKSEVMQLYFLHYHHIKKKKKIWRKA